MRDTVGRMLLLSPYIDNSILHCELMPTHMSVINAPRCNYAFYATSTKRTRVRVTAISCLSLCLACRRAPVFCDSCCLLCLAFYFARPSFSSWHGTCVALSTLYFTLASFSCWHGTAVALSTLFACCDNTCNFCLHLCQHLLFARCLPLCSCASQPCIGFSCRSAGHRQSHAAVEHLSDILICILLCEKMELRFWF